MNILLVNDDGIDSPRLKYAKDVLSAYGDVFVVAPKHQQSGKSVAISIGRIPFEMIDNDTYAVDGTPADCVSFALYALNKTPDLVVSGINLGYNIGVDTMYSGTVGAALQASFHGYKAIAFSGDFKGDMNIKRYFKRTFNHIIDNDMASKDYIINVNFPREKFSEDKGILHTELFYVDMTLEGKIENNIFTHKRRILNDTIPKDTDVYALREGYTSVSKIYYKRSQN